jgi:hypothetical protein
VGVCFRSRTHASVIRSVCDRLQLLTIHSFMNHEFILASQNSQGSVSSNSVPPSSNIYTTPGAQARTKPTIFYHRHGAWEPRASMIIRQGSPSSSAIPNSSFCQKMSSRSVRRRRETCQLVVRDCVKYPKMVSRLLKRSHRLKT